MPKPASIITQIGGLVSEKSQFLPERSPVKIFTEGDFNSLLFGEDSDIIIGLGGLVARPRR